MISHQNLHNFPLVWWEKSTDCHNGKGFSDEAFEGTLMLNY